MGAAESGAVRDRGWGCVVGAMGDAKGDAVTAFLDCGRLQCVCEVSAGFRLRCACERLLLDGETTARRLIDPHAPAVHVHLACCH